MNSDELWETTMNPATRKLVKVEFESLEETLKLFDVLMGKSSAARKEFIMNYDLINTDIDFFGEDSDE